jgi:hypothetical protein
MTTNAIYKAGVPAVSAVPSYTNSAVSATTGVSVQPNAAVSPQTGLPAYLSSNGATGTTVYGVKAAGSLNVNNLATVAPARNTPQS